MFLLVQVFLTVEMAFLSCLSVLSLLDHLHERRRFHHEYGRHFFF